MRLRAQYDGIDDPFEGDHTIVWRSLPEHALVTRATVTIEPRRLPGQASETIRFAAGGPTYGATIRDAGGNVVEVDFHTRRRAIAFTGLTVANVTALAVDIGGGIFLAVGADGTIPAAVGSTFDLRGQRLPAIDALRVRMSGAGSIDDFASTTIDITSTPSNVTLRFGKSPPFWSKAGELGTITTTPDITNAVQRALTDATVVDGYYSIPIGVHSDAIARIVLTLDVEYYGVAPLLPAGLREVVLPYDYAGVAKTNPQALQGTVPAGARIVSPQTSLQVRGAFDASRVASGPTGETFAKEIVTCSAAATLAQPVMLTADVDVTAVDIYVAADAPGANLTVDLREDFSGKPGTTSLLSRAAHCPLAAEASGQQLWTTVTVALPARLKQTKRYWLVIEAIDGSAKLGVNSAPDPTRLLQRSTDAGFSWRLAGIKSPLLMRLRTVPDRFQMPIEFAAGTAPHTQRVGLGAYDALGKIDAVIDRPEIAAAVQNYVAQAAPAPCAHAEMLQNSDFSQWWTIGSALGTAAQISVGGDSHGESIAIIDTFFDRAIGTILLDGTTGSAVSTFGTVQAVTCSGDGASLYAGDDGRILAIDTKTFALTALHAVNNKIVALAADPRSSTLYVLYTQSFEAIDVAAKVSRNVLDSLKGANALALTRDGAIAYVADSAEIVAFDLAAGTEQYRIAVDASALVLTADDGLLIAVDRSTARLVAFEANRGTPLWTAKLPQTVTLLGVAATSNAVYALGAARTGSSAGGPGKAVLAAVNSDGRVIESILLDIDPGEPAFLAAKPQGDRIYVSKRPLTMHPSGDRLFALAAEAPIVSVAVGHRQPAGWTLTAGTVTPLVSQDANSRIVAVLAEGALSQVVAVAPGCEHDLTVIAKVAPLGSSFAIGASTAQTPDAVVELFWRDAVGALLRGDSLALPASSLFVTQKTRSLPPAGTAQAEVRIRVDGGACLLQSVSLQATDALVQDNGWKREAGAAWSIVMTEDGNATILRNIGATAASLLQQIAVKPNDGYELALDARVIDAPDGGPYLEVRYQDSTGADAGTVQLSELTPLDFSPQLARLTAPPEAAIAKIRLTLPAGAALRIQRIGIDPRPTVPVTCTFIAQSPGELHVSNARIVYDLQPAPMPAPPPGGLSEPTPPGETPGKPTCATDPCHMPAKVSPVAQATSLPPPVSKQVRGAAMERDMPLTSIKGIGPTRARRLSAGGIRTVGDLAEASPEQVTAALQGMVAVTHALAVDLIERARMTLSAPIIVPIE